MARRREAISDFCSELGWNATNSLAECKSVILGSRMPNVLKRQSMTGSIVFTQGLRVALLLSVAAWGIVQNVQAADEAPAVAHAPFDAELYRTQVQPFLARYCYACHGAKEQESDLRLDTLKPDFASAATASVWIEVMDRMNLGEMPPEGELDVQELSTVTGWIAGELRHAERASLSSGGRVVLRRMNRAEYANTIRDLLGITFLPGESPLDFLPPDGTAEGFDKVSVALMLDPSLLDKYFEVAQQIARDALVDGPPKFPTEVVRMEMEDIATNRAIRYLCASSGITCRERAIVLMEGSTRSFGVMKYPGTRDEIPVKGLYRIRVRAWGEPGADGEPVVMRVRQNHPQADQEHLIETEVTTEPRVYEVLVPRDPKCGEYNVSIVNGSGFTITSRVGSQIRQQQADAGKAKDFEQVMRLQSRQQMENLTWSRPNPATADTSELRKLVVDWIECEGPIYEQWPPRSHQMLLFRGENATQDTDYLRAIFARLLPRAFRRPVEAHEVNRIVALCDKEIAAGTSFQDAVRVGLTAVLCSPKFLYIVEPSNVETARPLNDWELASRLSYFLWSSMPDEELLELASAGQLRTPEVLTAQINRMLADEKVSGFVQGFGGQWLRTHEFRNFMPDPRLYQEYDDKLGEAMVGEALAFFEEVVRSDEPVSVFMDSDWTMLNERLAEFYGIEGVAGDEFRRVTLPADSPRGGLLGMAGVAMRGSDGNRTKPVNRGVYVREVFFNDPPNPPPPNAGEVEPNIQGEKLTVRDRLIQHQQIASCAACHRGIDGYGLAMENFNAIGAWRVRQDGEDFRGDRTPPIDASGTLPSGQSFTTFEEFKGLLLTQRDRLARGLAEKMLTYALGRPVEPGDRGLVDRLAARMSEENDTIRSLVEGMVLSDAFLTK
jgi:mono/diheme cytochrome c family protein